MGGDDAVEPGGPGDSDDWRTTFRPDIPSPARIYDYLLGGKDNYPVDRQAGDEIVARLPNVREAVRCNRAFLRRAVRFLVNEAGIRQLIDIGTGLPTAGNVHDVARHADTGVRVVYVDNDPVVLAHGRHMLHGVPDTVILEHDLRAPGQILADPGLRRLIDFTEPVGILLVAILHFISDDDDPSGIIGELLAPFPPGSYLALSHGTQDGVPAVDDAANVYDEATAQSFPRRRDEVLALVRGLELVEPGMVWLPQWRPEPGAELPARPEEFYGYALVARKTGPPRM
jgi:S-adenosyl methyltransferase